MIHYLLEQLIAYNRYVDHMDDYKYVSIHEPSINQQILKMIKLLIINNIIDVNDTYYDLEREYKIWNEIKLLTRVTTNDKNTSSKGIYVDDLIDLLSTTINHQDQKYDRQQAIMRILIFVGSSLKREDDNTYTLQIHML